MCRAWSRSSQRQWIQRPFAVVSRLGDGVFWYSLMAAIPLVDGWRGVQASLHMLLTGLVALILYKSLKGMTRRTRPCHSVDDIIATVPPLDHYSFPSGHTLHAVSFTGIALYYYPELAWLLLPFTVLVATSRVVLGLHYPSDVLVATAVGLSLVYASLLILS
jgi:undecaprenyl-diphosphatase